LEITLDLREALAEFRPSEIVVQYIPHMFGSFRFGNPAIPLLMASVRTNARVTAILHELYIGWSARPDLAVGAVMQRLQLCGVLGAADRLFVTTTRRKSHLEAILRAARRDLSVGLILVGANAAPLAPRPHRGGPRLGIFSTLARTRRFDLMVDAFTLVCHRYPDAELILIGDLGTPESPRYRALLEHISQSPVANHVRLTGSLPLAKAAEEISGLDVYLLPDEAGASTRSSTLPIALGSGVPVVATCGTETARDFFVEGENIAYAASMTAAALADAALRVLEDPARANRLRAGGKLLYDRHLSWGAIADRLFPPAHSTTAFASESHPL
jgi:glycosyltransferase involved in cell wall biosynthesis